MDSNKIGEFIRELRLEKGLSQNQLADMIPISRQAISKWERHITIPDSSTLLRLSEIFDVNINELLTGKREENPSIEELENVALNFLDDSNKKSKQNRRIMITSICIIISLIIAFLVYYFINSYNSIKVYTISGESEHFSTHNGLLITAKEKCYLKLGEVNHDEDTEININLVRFYYKDKNGEHLLYESTNEDIVLIDFNGYEKNLSKSNLKNIIENSYLIITYNDGSEETINLVYKKDFTNDSYFFLSQKEEIESTGVELDKSLSEMENNIVDKIKERGEKRNNGYYIEIEDDQKIKTLVYTKNENEEKMSIVSDGETEWIYNFLLNRSFCFELYNNQYDSCEELIAEDIEKYLLN